MPTWGLLALAVLSRAEVVGFFRAADGASAVVMDDSARPGQRILFQPGTARERYVETAADGWRLAGGEVSPQRAAAPGLGTKVEVAAKGGSYFLPPFPASFFGPLSLHYLSDAGALSEVRLPVEGGTLRGFEVRDGALRLLARERRPARKRTARGRELEAFEPGAPGLVLLEVAASEARVVRRLDGADPSVVWLEEGGVLRADPVSGRLE